MTEDRIRITIGDTGRPEPNHNYKVLVRCYTYNQSNSIEDSLNGFSIQQTDFPYVCLIVDDCSRDGEQDVIKKWLSVECDMTSAEHFDDETVHVILVHHKSNTNCTFAVYLLKKNLYKQKEKKRAYVTPWRDHCEYEAMCEGDDFWINPLKLQKQISFLDEHHDYTMCFHTAYETWNDNGFEKKLFVEVQDRDYSGVEIFENWIVATASVVFRVEILESEMRKKVLNSGNFIFGDTPFFVICAELGKVRGFSVPMSVYRRSKEGATFRGFSSHDKRYLQRANHFLAFYEVFGHEYIKGLNIYQRVVWKFVFKNPLSFSLWKNDFRKSYSLSHNGFWKSLYFCINQILSSRWHNLFTVLV